MINGNEESNCFIGDLNLHPDVQKMLGSAKRIYIKDLTLREGEQSSFGGFSLEAKRTIVRALDELGVDYIQIGYLGQSESDRKLVTNLVHGGINAKIEGLVLANLPDWKRQIELTIENRAASIAIVYGISDIRLKYAFGISRQDALKKCVRAVEHARHFGEDDVEIEFVAADATRTDPDWLLSVFRGVIDAGADRMNIADTSGCISPLAMKYLVQRIKKEIPKPVGVHCHNDFGLALANSISAIEAGADFAETTVNGIGERAGNTALDELAMVLKVLYNHNLNIKTENLTALSAMVSELSMVPLPSNKAIVGNSAFTHILGTHQLGVRKNWFVYESFHPSLVGNKRRLPVSKFSDRQSILAKLDEIGVTLTDGKTDKLMEILKKETGEKNKLIDDDELVKIIEGL